MLIIIKNRFKGLKVIATITLHPQMAQILSFLRSKNSHNVKSVRLFYVSQERGAHIHLFISGSLTLELRHCTLPHICLSIFRTIIIVGISKIVV